MENVSDTMANSREKAVVMMMSVMVEKERLGRGRGSGQQNGGRKNAPAQRELLLLIV